MMTTTNSTNKPPDPQATAAPDTKSIPLSKVNITVYRGAHFPGEDGPQAVTIPGAQVATLLEWFIRQYPTGDVGLFTDQKAIRIRVEEISELCGALIDSDWGDYNAAGPFRLLRDVLEDYSLRLTVPGAKVHPGGATVRIPPMAAAPKAKAVRP